MLPVAFVVNMKKCESCGMEMEAKEDFGGGKEDNKYCVYCTDKEGNLKSREEVREGMINFYMKSKGMEREAAEKFVDEYMKTMPAWKE